VSAWINLDILDRVGLCINGRQLTQKPKLGPVIWTGAPASEGPAGTARARGGCMQACEDGDHPLGRVHPAPRVRDLPRPGEASSAVVLESQKRSRWSNLGGDGDSISTGSTVVVVVVAPSCCSRQATTLGALG
jgi:hypothetical protein